ncbi:hypothetical protein D3C76_1470680 [compost metagenome]
MISGAHDGAPLSRAHFVFRKATAGVIQFAAVIHTHCAGGRVKFRLPLFCGLEPTAKQQPKCFDYREDTVNVWGDPDTFLGLQIHQVGAHDPGNKNDRHHFASLPRQ